MKNGKRDWFEFLEETGYEVNTVADALPELRELQKIGQNPLYHGEGNVLCHTMEVCRALKGLPEWERLRERERGMVFLSAVFHDIGKSICTRMEEGVITSPRHAVMGAKLFRELCYRTYAARFSIGFWEREEVAYLIRYHGLPQYFMDKDKVDFYLYKARECVSFPLLYMLAKADVLGRICADAGELLTTVEYFKDYCMEIGCYDTKPVFAGPYTRFRYYRGSDVWPLSSLYDETKFPVYVMSGFPLAGKSTYIEEKFPDLPVVSLDDIRKEWKLGPKEKSRAVVFEARERARVFLREKKSFVWDATNIAADFRERICLLCERYGAGVTLIYVEVPYELLCVRNKLRERKVPQSAIDRMIQRLDMVEPTESYQVVYEVE